MHNLLKSFYKFRARFFMKLYNGFRRRIGGLMSYSISVRNVNTYQARPDDIFIVTYPKSGTTWLQNILVQIQTQGKAEFETIADASPTLESSMIELDQFPSPRFIKTHLKDEQLPADIPKIIYVSRHGLDVSRSFYFHHRKLLGFNGSFEEFYDHFIQGKVAYGSWAEHVASFSNNPKGRDILHLRFEDMKADLEGTIRKICEFTGQSLPEEAMAEVLHKCSFEYMKSHPEKFDLTYIHARVFNIRMGNFIRQGDSGDWKGKLNEKQLEAYRDLFDKNLASKGLDDYQE